MAVLFPEGPLPFYDMMRYHLGWVDAQGRPTAGGGKLLRPTLCLLACEAVGGSWHQALPAAAALELVHNFSLVHDDIEDVSPERHHRPTVWYLWGEAQAINVGDGLYTLAQGCLLRLAQQGVPLDRLVRALGQLNQACLQLCEGQYLDLSYQTRWDIGRVAYLDMIQRKTAALIRCSLELGAILGHGTEAQVQSLRRFGEKLGLAFQVRDDILDLWGEEKVTGKPRGNDILQRKKSLPIVLFLEQAGAAEKEELISIYQKEKLAAEDVERVLSLLSCLGVQAQAQEMAETYYQEALFLLRSADLASPALAELETLAAFLVQREG